MVFREFSFTAGNRIIYSIDFVTGTISIIVTKQLIIANRMYGNFSQHVCFSLEPKSNYLYTVGAFVTLVTHFFLI